MGMINWNRVILGGLVAGVIINAFEYLLNAIVLAKDWASVMTGLGKTGEMSGASIVLFNVWGFLLGIAALWLYAAIRPCYGPGLKTALCAGSAIWLVGIVLAGVTPLALGLFPTRLVYMGMAVGFVEVELGRLSAPGSTAKKPPDPQNQKTLTTERLGAAVPLCRRQDRRSDGQARVTH